jgi:hypothetical protein
MTIVDIIHCPVFYYNTAFQKFLSVFVTRWYLLNAAQMKELIPV